MSPSSPVDGLAALRDQLELGLSEHPPEGAPPVAELAELIKALPEANTVEAAPERTETRKATRAERPVTARIRAKLGEQAAEVMEEVVPLPVGMLPELSEQPEPESVVIPIPEPVKTVEGYRQRITRGRKTTPEQLRLF